MHGKKRQESKAKLQDPKTAALLSQKAEGWHQLCQALATRRRSEEPQGIEDVEKTLALLSKALLVNPDPLHLWNFRRETLLLVIDKEQAENEEDETPACSINLQPELDLTQGCLERNPKAYGAWMHRKWALGQVRPSVDVLERERELTSLFLKADERNFHCWNYRRFVVGCLLAGNDGGAWNGEWKGVSYTMGSQLASWDTDASQELSSSSMAKSATEIIRHEFDFTTKKISDNFSNFSAFFYRSQLLPLLDVDVDWEEELQLIENAVCTEPDDQTAWWYHALLLSMDIFPLSNLKDRLREQNQLLRELLDDSPNCKWIWMGLHRVLEATCEGLEEQRSCLLKLQEIDPDRHQRYQEQLMSISVE